MTRFILALALACLAHPALADRILAEATCTNTEMDLHFRCDIVLTANGAPVDGAAFTVTPAMPSMPMAHNIPPVEAAATDEPGTYTAELQLEMAGDWTLTLDLTNPRRDRVVVSHRFEAQVAEGHGTDHSGHAMSD